MAVLPLGPHPVGYRFHPTDEELLNHYLKRKIAGRIGSGADDVIPEVDVCRCEPWDLPGRSVIRSDDPEWFFFSPRDRKYPNGLRHNRATVAGYWKATGKDRLIKSRIGGGGGGRVVVGMKKTLVFHLGRAPKGDRTNWIMHEYRTTEPEYESGFKGSFVLCRLFRKSEESLPSSNADEMDRSDLSPTLTRSSPSETQHGEDALDESTVPVNQVSSETNLQENSQPMVLPANNQSAGSQSCLDDTAILSAPCPSKQEQPISGITMAYKAVDDTARAKDDLAKLFGPEFGQLNPDDFFCKSSPEPYLDCQFSDHFDKGLSVGISEVDGTEQDSDTEFLDALLSNQEDDFPELLNAQKLVSKFPKYDICCPEPDSSWDADDFLGAAIDGSSCDAVSCKDSGSSSYVDMDTALAQKDPVLETTAHFGRPLFLPGYSQMNTSNEYRERLPLFNATHTVSPEERVQENAQLTEKSIDPQKLTGRGVSHGISTQTDRTTGESSYVGPSINMRTTRPTNYLRSKHVLQGSTEKRLILQISATDTESSNIEDKHEVNLTESKIADDVMLQTAKEIAVSDSHLDELDSFSDHGDMASVEIKPAFQQNCEELMTAVRLRRKSKSVSGNGLRGQSLPLVAPRRGSIHVIRIVVVSMLIFLLICGGIYCYLNLCTDLGIM